MVSDKIKEIIFKKLYKDLKEVEIIPYNGGIWFINRKEKYWYLELNPNNHLWWRYSFFTNFFDLFSLDIKEFEPLIREWTEWILNRNIENSNHSEYNINFISNYNILTTRGSAGNGFHYDKLINDILCYKIESSSYCKVTFTECVKVILNQPNV